MAVSGGSDSLALLGLMREWAANTGIKIFAATVDHRLRLEAAEEAEMVARVCASWGINHTTLRWGAPKSAARHARLARHRLLAEHAAKIGANSIFLGHTHDDQLETLLIRLEQGSGLYGLGGMDAVALSPVWLDFASNIILIRPLLSATRGALQSALVAQGIDWVSDPSNVNSTYLRPNVRALLADNAALARQVEGLYNVAQKFRKVRQAQTADLLRHMHSDGVKLILPRAPLPLSYLANVLQAVSGKTAHVRHDRAMAFVKRAETGNIFRTALHGCKISVRKREITLQAEFPEAAPGISAAIARLQLEQVRVKIGQFDR